MKERFLFLMIFIASYCFSQSVNDYKAVIIPLRYVFQNSENQYLLQTKTKVNLQKAGFQAFYSNEEIPLEFNERCSLLTIDVNKENAFLQTKLYIVFKDCYGKEIFRSEIGRSREKEYETAYGEAFNEAFKSVYSLNYKYNEVNKSKVIPQTEPIISTPAVVQTVLESKTNENKSPNLLYAQPTSYGYQLIDSEPKVVMKVYKTSNPASYMATKGTIQGVLISKENQWFFEYYENDKLISEKVEVKF